MRKIWNQHEIELIREGILNKVNSWFLIRNPGNQKGNVMRYSEYWKKWTVKQKSYVKSEMEKLENSQIKKKEQQIPENLMLQNLLLKKW